MLSILLLYGCVSLDRGSKSVDRADGRDEKATIRPRTEREFSEIHTSYDLESLLLPVLQYNNLSLSFDFFPQFRWSSDEIFPRYLARTFKLEQSPYRQGEGTVLIAGYGGMGTELRIERALLSRETDGDWWKIQHSYFDETIFYEVLISAAGYPVRIRYLDPETNKAHEVILAIASEPHILKNESTDESQSGEGNTQNTDPEVEGLRAQEFAKEWSYAFNQPLVIGEEMIDVQAGQFLTVHVRDTYDDEYGTGADYWISPDVPGNIVRIVYSSPGQEPYIIELQELTVGNTSVIVADEVAEGLHDVGDSEGSPSEPKIIAIGEPHVGWVAPGGTSYYRLTAERRADIYISIEVFGGDAELNFYGADPTFYNVRNTSSGGELFAEEYFVQPGTDLFFTVVNSSVDEERNFTIGVAQDVFLSPLGVAMRGEIYYRARELKPGRTYEETLNIDGLSYYMTRVRKGRHLRITASDLHSGVVLLWFEAAEGSYSGVYTYREGDLSSIEISDVAPGTECYFYVVADILETPPASIFSLTIEEYTRH